MNAFTYKNIPVEIHPTFFLLPAIIIFPSLISLQFYKALMLTILLIGLFLSVIMHEFGHALMAKKFGMSTRSITLYPFGGLARVENMTEGGRAELFIALAGPAVNVLLSIVLLPLMLMGVPLCTELLWLNLIMAIFNLLPAYPMDGGRVLRATLAKWLTKEQATRWSLRISIIFAALFFIVGVTFKSISLLFVSIALAYFIHAERKRLLHEEKRQLEWEMFRKS